MSVHPKDFDYSNPAKNCDLVMKGGITSGVVYPWAVCELATTYRFRNIGGTSAGAIAAVAAAAAEFGRDSSDGGFRRLAALPDWLKQGRNLRDLFQPEPTTRPLFRLISAGMGRKFAKLWQLGAVIAGFPAHVVAGAALGIALILLSLSSRGVIRPAGVFAGVLLALLGAVLGVLLGVWSRLGAVSANGFGMCLGRTVGTGPPGLTDWLDAEIERLAGRTPGADPLTIGHLWLGTERGLPGEAARLAAVESGDASAEVDLRMITTSLTEGRPRRLPLESREFFFDPDEMRARFPDHVVSWMERHPPATPSGAEGRAWELRCRLLSPLRPLPAPADIPIVVAARMSLSFPVLISAVPLWTVDMTRVANQKAGQVWRDWMEIHVAEWPKLRDDDAAWNAVEKPTRRPDPVRCWFSDGGITSNFPVHFFDSPIPRWPTFAINLRPFHPDHPKQEDESRNVYMPSSNRGGIQRWWSPIRPDRKATALISFMSSIADTMQNWKDNEQLEIPGYRDRIAHVSHTHKEGGMNLAMPEKDIEALSERGGHAGSLLRNRFSTPAGDGTPMTWDNHRWVRYRSTMSLLEDTFDRFSRNYLGAAAGERSYEELLTRGNARPASYRMGQAQAAHAVKATRDLVALSRRWQKVPPGSRFGNGAPSPSPALRIVPKV